jgi:hypothetical protein
VPGRILGGNAALTPATVATLSSAANGSGWRNADVQVTLTATPTPAGPGVKQITYSATGAQSIAATTNPGGTVAIPITAEGVTSLDFFATDDADTIETTEHLTVELDKSPPSIPATRTPPPNAAGWNNTDVTVSFDCADSVSGMLSCPDPIVVSAEGANQSVTGVATDFAFNSASMAVSGINIDKTPPTVTCSVAIPSLTSPWPPNHNLVTVGLRAFANDAIQGPVPVTVSVFGNEDDQESTGDGNYSPDAKDIADGTLRLRTERNARKWAGLPDCGYGPRPGGEHRVQLLHRRGSTRSDAASIASVQSQAAAASSFSLTHNGSKPRGYFVVGDGPTVGTKQ